MIELVDATVGSGGFVLSQLSFRVEAGEYAVVMGRTGIGKTTILESICGLRPLMNGKVLISGQDVTKWSAPDRNVGYVPQDLALFPTMTVRSHLEFAMRLRSYTQVAMSDQVNRIAEVLRIEKLLDRKVTALSGGEAQRVALGRAISFGPSILLLDEPLSALDTSTRSAAHEMLSSINRETGVTVLHVTHNESEADALADRKITIASDHGKAIITTQNRSPTEVAPKIASDLGS